MSASEAALVVETTAPTLDMGTATLLETKRTEEINTAAIRATKTAYSTIVAPLSPRPDLE